MLGPGCRASTMLVALLLVGGSVLLWARFCEPRLLTVTRTEIVLPHLAPELDGTRLVLISDLHGAAFGPQQELLGRAVAAQNPQAIVFAGDLVDANRGGVRAGIELLAAMAAIAPTFLVWGNHDYLVGVPDLRREIATSGLVVHDLDQGWAALELEGGSLIMCGLAMSWRNGGEGLAEQAQAARAALGQAVPLVVVAHSPGPKALAKAAAGGADLFLAGHTHGGQIRLPLVGALWSPVDGYLPGQAHGLDRLETGWSYVTRGLGTSVLPMRLLCPPEIAVLTLRRL